MKEKKPTRFANQSQKTQISLINKNKILQNLPTDCRKKITKIDIQSSKNNYEICQSINKFFSQML